MHIVIEGPDNSGKSTLALAISMATGYQVVASEGPPKFHGEMNQRVMRYETMRNKIFDRHPCVSNLIYDRFRQPDGIDNIAPEFVEQFYASNPLIIYCVGRDLEAHVLKPHDSELHKATVEMHHNGICRAYDEWARERAHIIYRVGDDVERVLRIAWLGIGLGKGFDPVRDLEQFHEKFMLVYTGKPRMLQGELGRFRDGFLHEEVEEYSNWADRARGELKVNIALRDSGSLLLAMEGAFDSLIDLVYVAIGTAYLHGFNFREGWRRVHEANMRKVRTESRDASTRNSIFDVVKPPGWEPPSLVDLIEDHAHQ